MKREGKSFISLLLYVGDIIVVGYDDSLINELKIKLDKIKDFGTLKYFLGIEVARSQNGIKTYTKRSTH